MQPTTIHDKLDPYTSQAQNDDITLQEKVTDLHNIIKHVSIGMLTSRAVNGQLHSRAMASCAPHSDTQLTLYFIANNASHKFDELQNDSSINVSFYDPSSTSWVSYAGTAKVSQDADLIHKHWSTAVSAYFGDLKDGIHKGDEHDPRVSIIEVVPQEIKYLHVTKGAIGRNAGVAVGVLTGHVAVPGELRTINKEEIQLVDDPEMSVEQFRAQASYVLPEDVLSRIFLEGQALSTTDKSSQPWAFELEVSKVSRFWRFVALNTHILWRSIRALPEKSLPEIRTYLQRSGECPIDIHFNWTHWAELDVPPTVELMDLLVAHPVGWRRAIIQISLDDACLPLLTYIQSDDNIGQHLQYLSLTACAGDGHLQLDYVSTLVQTFKSGAPELTFVRLRGFAVHCLRPPLTSVVTLHVEISRTIPMQYETFKQVVAASPHLTNLSFYGDGDLVQAWPSHESNTITLPNLKSLRLWLTHGPTLSKLMVHVHAPLLQSLVLKEVQEDDLDIFWIHNQGPRDFPNLKSLTFHDFEFSDTTYHKAGAAFPGITHFTLMHTTFGDATIVRMLGSPAHARIWPELHTLSLVFSATDGSRLWDMVSIRASMDIPLERLRLGGSNPMEELTDLCKLQEHVEVETFEETDDWREGYSMYDEDDRFWD
ncbi:hypothetical protein ONZ45_g8072 [Pleurotus djamor]|nr:hypothetical protein ONZ45_g8072 [Pleurotus djamor]